MINLTIGHLNHFFKKRDESEVEFIILFKQVYVGGFSYWSEHKLQTGLLKTHIRSLPVGGAFGTSEI